MSVNISVILTVFAKWVELIMSYEVIVKIGANRLGRDKKVTYTCPNLETSKDRKTLEHKTNPKASIIIMRKG